MPSGREYSRHQEGIIRRYYEHRDTILANKLSEIVSELALNQANPNAQTRLWKRAETALAKLSPNDAHVRKALADRSVEALAQIANKLA